jgi:hypothetical protein
MMLNAALLATLLLTQSPITTATESSPAASAETQTDSAADLPEAEPVAQDVPAEPGGLAAADELAGVPETFQPSWIVRAGGNASLTEGNSSTRAYGASLNINHEGLTQFLQLDGFGQYGLTRIPARRPIPEAPTVADQTGRPGTQFEENINNWSARGKYGYYLGDTRSQYLYGFSSLEGDTFRGFWWRYEVQTGYGRRLSNDRLVFKAELGPSFTEEKLIVRRHRSRLAVAANISIDYRINDSLSVREELTHQRTVASNDLDTQPFVEHRSRSKTDVIVTLTERFNLQLSGLLEHASNPSPGAHPLDTRFTTSIIYSFL